MDFTFRTSSKYQNLIKTSFGILLAITFLLSGAGCTTAQNLGSGQVSVVIEADGQNITVEMPSGSTVSDALTQARVSINNLDKVTPAEQTILSQESIIQIVRVQEEFEIEESVIPFQNQKVFNESLPEGQTLLIQPGSNGTQQITYRKVIENGVETSRSLFKKTILQEPQPEIVMVGVQTPFTAVSISGKLAYLTSSNAWMMESTTGNRRPLVTSGDLDGRIFSLSADGSWLLYSRSADQASETINSLWVVNTSENNAKPISLRVENVVHFADWIPGRELTIAYSTVEPRSVAPGWQANNDLQFLTINSQGVIISQEEIIEANAGGIYGWWGTNFEWSGDGSQLAYSRPDSIGVVDFENNSLVSLIDLIPLQTRSDWAWVPEINWSPDRSILYSVTHKPMPGLASDEISPLFDLTAILPDENISIDLIPQAGMFSGPEASPLLPNRRYYITYLQATFPEQSESSRYKLMMMDHDGSNRITLFPPEGSTGLEPQKIQWGIDPVDNQVLWIAFSYQGNLWLLNTQNNQSQQITGDGSISRIDWK